MNNLPGICRGAACCALLSWEVIYLQILTKREPGERLQKGCIFQTGASTTWQFAPGKIALRMRRRMQ